MYSPLISVFVNVLAGAAVAHGLIDIQSKDQFVQLADNALAGLVTFGVAVYSIYKTFEIHKHGMNLRAGQQTTTITTPTQAQQTTEVTQITETPGVQTEQQTGLPLE